MGGLSRAQRRVLAEQLAAWVRERVQDEANEVDFTVENGIDLLVGDDLESARPVPNGSATLVVRINGGARQTRGLGDEGRGEAA